MKHILNLETFFTENINNSTTVTGTASSSENQSVFGESLDQSTAKRKAEAELKKITGAMKVSEKCFKTTTGNYKWVIFYNLG